MALARLGHKITRLAQKAFVQRLKEVVIEQDLWTSGTNLTLQRVVQASNAPG